MHTSSQPPAARPSLRLGLAIAVAGSGIAALTGVPAASAHPAPSADRDGDCRVLRLKQADRFSDGSVMDIEEVDGKVVYYGNGYRFDRSGEEHQRAFVWFGRHAEPVRVGPRGYDQDIAYELTASGLVNGSSQSADGTSAQWVQDLRTMQLSFFDADSGPRGTDHGFTLVRRINDGGAATGGQVRDPADWATDAIAFDSVDGPLRLLPGSAEAVDAIAYGINSAGDRAGITADGSTHPDSDFLRAQPRVWRADGSVESLALQNALDAFPRAIKDDGGVSGELVWGDDISTAHVEAGYWPTPEETVGLGVLPGGGWSAPFGMDEGGVVVGVMDRGVREGHRYGPEGWVDHGFHWSPELGEGIVRILPSFYGDRHGTGWKTWATGHAVHAVNGELDQAGTATHWRFRGDRLVHGPTIWLNVSECGVLRPTTHDPFGLQSGAGQRSAEPRVDVRSWRSAVLQSWRGPLSAGTGEGIVAGSSSR